MVHWRHGYRPRPGLPTLRGVVVALALAALVVWATGRLVGQAYDHITISRVAR